MAEDEQSSVKEGQAEVDKKEADAQASSEAIEEPVKETEQESSNASSSEEAANSNDSASEEALKAEIVALKDEVKKYQDQALRTQAEAHNVRRRAEADVEKAHKFGIEKFAKELLPVIDNLERAIDSMAGDEEVIKPLREGVEMTLSMFSDGLAKFKVEVVNPEGAPFDPEHHQAMSMQENNDVEPNTVLMVMQKGYTLNGRLIRPALVAVSKEGSSQEAPKDTPKIDEQA